MTEALPACWAAAAFACDVSRLRRSSLKPDTNSLSVTRIVAIRTNPELMRAWRTGILGSGRLRGVTTSILAVLLSKQSAPLSVLSAVPELLTVQTTAADAHDAQVVKLMTEQRVQDLIDRIETLLRNDR